MDTLTNRVKVRIYFYGLTIEINNFVFEVKVILALECTILDGWLACRVDGEAENRISYSPVGSGTGAEFGNKIHNLMTLYLINLLLQLFYLDFSYFSFQ